MGCSSVAPGMMPSSNATGITMVICSGAGLTTIVLDADGKPTEVKHTLCDWSVNHAALGENLFELPQPRIQIAKLKTKFAKSQALFLNTTSNRHRPRAPPTLL